MQQQDLPPLSALGDPDLTTRQPPVTDAGIRTPGFQARLERMVDCMRHNGGFGIAAPQIAWSARVFCLGIETSSSRYPEAEPIPLAIWINPVIKDHSSEANWAWEGSLSVPGMRGWVERPAEIEIAGLDPEGANRTATLTGFAARVFQHEIDLLDGVLLPARVADLCWLIPDAVLARRDQWREDWPSQKTKTPTTLFGNRGCPGFLLS